MNLLTKSALTLGAAAAMLSNTASVFAGDFEDYAKVLSVTPQVERVNVPRQECRDEVVQVQRQQRHGDAGGAVAGGLIGGLIGSQVGNGNGKTAATAVGAIAGAMIGGGNGETVTTTENRPVRSCRTVDTWEQRTTGYVVTYQYRGQTQTAVTAYDPGPRLRLRVTTTPL